VKVCAIVPAAGRSERFGRGDKLGQDLGGRPLLVRTVELLAKRDDVTSILVAGPPDEIDDFRERYGPTLGFLGASVVPGGKAARWETVQSALAHVPDDVTHVAVHDAARPAASAAMLDRLFEAASMVPAVIPGVPIQATVKRGAADARTLEPRDDDDALAEMILGDAGRVTIEARAVEETIDRRHLYAIQTPQVFELDLLRRAYAQDDLTGATDDASLVERLGGPVQIVAGDIRNIKVTTPEDLELVRAILKLKPPTERPVHKRF